MEKSRILLVEDDDTLREIVKRELTHEGLEVDAASDGESARNILGMTRYDLVVSDLRLPGVDGISLLELVKERYGVPFILITAYGNARVREEAYLKGVDFILPKPFDRNALVGTIKGLLGAQDLDVGEDDGDSDLPKEFFRVSLADFVSVRNIPYSLYIRLSDDNIVKLAHRGEDLEQSQLASYRDKGVRYLYMDAEDYRKYVGFTLQLTSAIGKSNVISESKKRAFLKHAGEVILERVFVSGVDREGFDDARVFIHSTLDVLSSAEAIVDMLSNLNAHADFVYAHSVGVSLYSVMIARALGWNAPPTLFKIATAGLFHDIGLKELDRELLEKPRIAQNAAERKEYATHPTRGAELLSQVNNVPVDVIQVAAQHHEDIQGNGYPNHLSKSRILPMAKLISVADVFCEYAIKSPDSKGMPAHAAIEQIDRFKAAGLDPAMLAALKDAVAGRDPRRRFS